jgi:hypothetical protein
VGRNRRIAWRVASARASVYTLNMSITVIKQNNSLRIVSVDGQIEEGKTIRLLTEDEFLKLERERVAELEVQMPAFVRGDENESAEDLFPVK